MQLLKDYIALEILKVINPPLWHYLVQFDHLENYLRPQVSIIAQIVGGIWFNKFTISLNDPERGLLIDRVTLAHFHKMEEFSRENKVEILVKVIGQYEYVAINEISDLAGFQNDFNAGWYSNRTPRKY